MTDFGKHFTKALVCGGIVAIALPIAGRAHAQYAPCPTNIDLKTTKLTEIVSQGGVLAGTVVLADEQRAQTLAPSNNVTKCLPQLRRFYQDHESLGPLDIDKVRRPVPGPTLRATVGDIVQLTFLNQIDLLDYGNSIDRYETAKGNLSAPGAGCDAVTTPGGYPQLGTDAQGKPVFDSMPNCFHGSSTGNLHFHGTHTNPNTTGDDVFLGVRPSPRVKGVPLVTAAYVKNDFDAFFAQCKSLLQANSLNPWPVNWQSNGGLQHFTLGPDSATFRSQQTLLKEYDATLPPVSQSPDPRALWPVDDAANQAHQWPIYYVGAFPYCFVLPEFPGRNAGAKPRMGQAPGTHWYHAHKHGSTHLNVSNGMAGAFIIEGPSYDGMLDAFYNQYRTDTKTGWTRQQTTMVVAQLGGVANLEVGAGGKSAFAVNGQINPDITMYPGEVQMWRIVNTSAISGFYLPSLPAGFSWRQIAQDGVQFDDENYRARIERPVFVAAGNRIDLLVQASPTLKPGATSVLNVVQGVSVSTAQQQPANVPLVTIRIGGSGKSMPFIPHLGPRPSFLNDIAASEVVNKTPRELTFNTAGVASGQSEHTINNVKFGQTNPWLVPDLNVAEEWKVINTTAAPIDHPFHIHINPFQIAALFDPNQPLMGANNQPVKDAQGNVVGVYVVSTTAPAPGSLQPGQCWVNPNDPKTFVPCAQPGRHAPPYGAKTNIWWDVFPIPAARTFTPPGANAKPIVIPGYFVMRSRFVDYAGNYVMHCHILAHEDRGMMMTVEVATNIHPPPHH